VLDLRSLKDYGGQPLVFSSPAFMRMRVTKDTLDSDLVQRYIAMGMLTYEPDAEHSGAPVPVKASVLQPPPVVPAPALEPAPAPSPEPEPEPEPAPEPTSLPEVPSVLETPSEVSPELAPVTDTGSEPTKKTPRRR
jgi:hypothetical protein